MLWYICNKKDILWIRWIHLFFIKDADVNTFQPKASSSWILKAIFKYIYDVVSSSAWHGFKAKGKFDTGKLYTWFRGEKPTVFWKNLMYVNRARRRAIFTIWLAYQNRLPTKERLIKIGIVTDVKCVYCGLTENCNHLYFECAKTWVIWLQVLAWFRITHGPEEWQVELPWVFSVIRGKS